MVIFLFVNTKTWKIFVKKS